MSDFEAILLDYMERISVALETIAEGQIPTTMEPPEHDGLFDSAKGELIASTKMSFILPVNKELAKRLRKATIAGDNMARYLSDMVYRVRRQALVAAWGNAVNKPKEPNNEVER